MKRLLVAIAAIGMLAGAFAFFSNPAAADTDTFEVSASGGTIQATFTPQDGCSPDEGQVGAGGETFSVPTFDPENVLLDTDCDFAVSFASSADCVLEGSWEGGSFGEGDSPAIEIDWDGSWDPSSITVTVTDDCATDIDHDIYKNVPIADADVFALTTFQFAVAPSEGSPDICTGGGGTPAVVEITGDGSPSVVLTVPDVAESVYLVGSNSIDNCFYDITELPLGGWTNEIPLFGMTQFDETPGEITPFRNSLDPVGITVTKSMDLDDFVVLSNIDTGLLDERIDFFISATEGCQDTIITAFNNQLGSTGTFVNTSPAQVELAGFNDNVFAGEDVPIVVDGEPCTYTVEELPDEDLAEYCAPVNGPTQSLTWTPGLTSFDFLFHNDCEAPAEPEPTPDPTPTPDVDDDGGTPPGGPNFAG